MTTNISMEQNLVLLLSIYDLGGAGTKKSVLDNIEDNQYLTLSAEETQYKNNRPELVWRNRLAFVRKHLVQKGYINDDTVNSWKITKQGMEYLQQLCSEIVQVDISELKKLNSNAVNRILEIDKSFKVDYGEREKELLEDLGERPNEKKEVTITRIKRYQKIVKDLKIKYESKCQIEGCNFTFIQKNGNGYSEAHHLQPLCEDGSQEEYNVVILCPNHHRMIHYTNVKLFENNGSRRKITFNEEEHYIVYR